MYQRYMIKHLKAPKAPEKGEVGNKAYTLNRLHNLGYLICDGFVLTSAFFKRFCTEHRIDKKSPDITKNIQNSIFDEFSRTLLEKVFKELCIHTGRLIVRSSGIEEDGCRKSYAGIFKSVSDIKSFDDMLSAIKTVWCSYFTETASGYHSGEPITAAPVLIQSMIACDRSGVAFTRNPVSRKSELIIEACAENSEIIINNKRKAVRYVLPARKIYFDKLLSKEQLAELRILAERLEHDLGYPCDFEWGIQGKKLYLFQARPIGRNTEETIYTAKNSDTLDCILLDRYANPASVCYLSLLASWQEKVYLSYYRKRPGKMSDEKPLCFLYNRVYWNMKYQKQYFEDRGSGSVSKKIKLFFLIRNGYKSWYKRIPAYEKKIQLYKEQTDTSEDPKAIIHLLDEVIENFCVFLGVDHFRFLGIAQILYQKARQKHIDIDTNIKTIYQNKTVLVNRELIHLLEKIKSNKQTCSLFLKYSDHAVLSEINKNRVDSDFAQMFRCFINNHGHRSVSCDDLYDPHWGEDPAKVICLLQNLLKNNITEDREKMQEKHRSEKLAAFTAEYMCLRENQRYYFDKSWVLIRVILLKLSDYYLSKKVITDRQDIFHMTIDEIKDGILYRNYAVSPDIILQRKSNYERQKEQSPPYMLRNSSVVSVQKNKGKSYKVLGISNGTASGPVKIINNLCDIKDIQENCICVVKTFHPSWTPILKIAAGLVMCYGNMLSHGAVVAREYQIPVVVFNDDATKIFRDGDRVQLDGSAGRIRLLQRK